MSDSESHIPCKNDQPIDAILFDMGGTLRRNHKRELAEKVAFVQPMIDLLNLQIPPLEFTRLLESREASYDSWATENLVELNEFDLWTKWMLPDVHETKVRQLAMQLNEIWREAIASRVIFPETRETIVKLQERGYRLALVSNTTSSVDSPRTLEREGLAEYFDAIVLSCVFGKRKPAAEILLHAAACLNVDPSRCVYIGDRPDWDVVAARRACYSKVVILEHPDLPIKGSLQPEHIPDCFIHNLLDLLDLFPWRTQ